jgi:dTMP kinase
MQRGYFITLEGLDGSGKTTQIRRLAAWLQKHSPPAFRPAAPTPASSLDPTDAGVPSLRRFSGERVGSKDAASPDPTLSLPKACPELAEGGLASETWDSPHLVLLRQPGGTATGDRIRTLVLDSRASHLAPMAEMALMFADRAQAIAEVIQPALDAGRIVLCDRFTDSTEAYQGGGRQLGSEVVLELHRLLCGNLQPDLTILLLPSLGISLQRARRRNDRVQAQTGQDEGRFEGEKEAFFSRVWQQYRAIARREPERVVVIEGDLGIDEVHEQIVEAVSERLIAAGLKD